MSIETEAGSVPNIRVKSQAQGANIVGSISPPVEASEARTMPKSVEEIGIQPNTGAVSERDVKVPRGSKIKKSPSTCRLGPEDTIGAGDSRIIHDVLSPPLIENAFELLREEVCWETMHHRSGKVPRLVAVQGEIDEAGGVPIYRHPADESPTFLPFIPIVKQIKEEVETLLHQPFNHALIQLYRDGIDNISEHSDKVCCFFARPVKL